MRKYLKSIMREVIREEIKERPLIIASRPPSEEDVYKSGVHWEHGQDLYVLEKVQAKWTKVT